MKHKFNVLALLCSHNYSMKIQLRMGCDLNAELRPNQAVALGHRRQATAGGPDESPVSQRDPCSVTLQVAVQAPCPSRQAGGA